MRPIPPALRKQISQDEFFKKCCMPLCGSEQVEIDHVWVYARQQVNELWALLPLCYSHHRGGYLNRPYTQWLSLQRATEDDLAKYPKKDWATIKNYLKEKYDGRGN